MHIDLSWDTPAYEYRKKSTDWYWALGILSLSFAAAAYILNNALFGILVLLSGFTLALYGSRRPDMLHCRIAENGISINNLLYPYSSLKAFWVDETARPPMLIIASKKFFASYIMLSLPSDISTTLLREELKGVLTEEEMRISMISAIFERLGF
jgi:hypothetical protein